MPIKPPNQSSKVREAPNNFTQKRLREGRGPFRHYGEIPGPAKGNRESSKTDREVSKGDRLYSSQQFKEAIGAAEEDFRKRAGGGGGW